MEFTLADVAGYGGAGDYADAGTGVVQNFGGWLPVNVSAPSTPADFNPEAKDWTDLLKFGISSAVSYKLNSQALTARQQNTAPAPIAPVQSGWARVWGSPNGAGSIPILSGVAGGVNLGGVLLIGGLGYLAYKAFSGRKG